MKFTLEIELGNDAMQTNDDIAKSLQTLAHRLSQMHRDPVDGDKWNIRDANGNTVGKWEVIA
jgi:hypothetical protein